MEALSSLPRTLPRVLGTYGGRSEGPLVLCLGGIHGNEPAGVVAAQRVLAVLGSQQPPFRGELLALVGNRAALLRRCRYLEQDLNRVWFADRIAALQQGTGDTPLGPEDTEQRELLQEIEAALARRRGPVIFLDLHTTSAAGTPFTVIADTLLNRRLALSLPAPVILGLEEHLEGTTLNYMNDRGYMAVGFEGGQNESPAAVDHHELAIWMMLVTTGCLQREAIPRLEELRQRVSEQTKGVPPILDIRYRHAVQAEDQFVMEPGFTNFQPVARGQLLARDRRGDIRAAENGYVLMPLYQSQGTDGFFLVREVKPFWLTVSAWLRRLRLETLLPWLPGIRRHPERTDTLIVDRRVARWFVIELFHLLGYRRQRAEGEKLMVSRRPHDVSSFKEW
ncbi:MAG: aspartoacylase [Deltaproteobacteria bacterium]|nr:aspartoacylase [Deltaproteobacteria bacterium]